MKEEIIRIESISQLHKMIGYEEPEHPLISVIEVSKLTQPNQFLNVKMTSDFYTIMLKDANCGLVYGRNYYDFEEGVLIFLGPNQVVQSTSESHSANGWMLFFHPDLFRSTHLGQTIDQYSFFSYDVHEALHLSKKEENILNDCVDNISYELSQNIDGHSRNLLVSNLELMLNYCNRFYERQFNTRTTQNQDIISKVTRIIKDYYNTQEQLEHGTISIDFIANNVNLSANYLSDLLKKETGRNTKEHINDFVVNKAKSLILSTNKNISEIAYDLGFNYPHYFSRMFKKNTGLTPEKYRNRNLNQN
ncbi:MAG: helix-turn-helix domain-containing protein [Flavobacteriales bacterium]|nr:helix-turn-helix domain-containing protein [Flavobacteriales bacterium]